MQGVLSTEIKFIEGQSRGNIPATGDLCLLLALILISCAIVFSVVWFKKFKNQLGVNNISFGGFVVKHKIATVCAGLALIIGLVLLTFGLVMNANASVGLATEESGDANAVVAKSVNAYVDMNTGDVAIENGFIKNQDPDFSLAINKIMLTSNEDFGKAKWSLRTQDSNELYGKTVNDEQITSLDIDKMSEKIIKYKPINLNPEIAKSFSNKASIKVDFYYKINAPQIDISGNVDVKQTETQKAARSIEASGQKVNYTTNDGSVYSSDVDENGNYTIYDVPVRSIGTLSTGVIGCNLRNDKGELMHNHQIVISDPLILSLENQDFYYEGPEFDNYTVPELKLASSDLSANNQSSVFYKEFENYINDDVVWWSNSDSQQSSECTSQAAFNAKINLCNQDYKCHFTTMDDNPDGAAAPNNQYLFLRIIGINQDKLSDAANGEYAGLTLQAISCLPNVYQYGYFDANKQDSGWEPAKEFGRFWGDENCQLRADMNSENGEIYSGLADTYKNNIVAVDKKSQRTHKWPNTDLDIVTTSDKLFPVSYTEMIAIGTCYPYFFDFPMYQKNSEGAPYMWYQHEGISGYSPNEKIKNMSRLNNAYQIQLGFNPWTRSVYHKTDHNFLYMNSDDGNIYKDNSYENYYSVVLAFCL